MAVQYKGLVERTSALRESAAASSHLPHGCASPSKAMEVRAPCNGSYPRDLDSLGPREALYTVLLNEAGGIRDDLIIYGPGPA